jgi:threonylcarbamoyladenosine tRNA methylthiotransferase MtaB
MSPPLLFNPTPGLRFAVKTLGCKVNQYESQAIREAWEARGLVAVNTPDKADIVLVNSCAVTSRAVQGVRATVRRLAKAHPAAQIVVTGCAAQILPDQLAAMDQVHVLVPQSNKPLLTDVQDANDIFSLSISRFTRSRAVIKIQDGCSHGCSYCIVPKTRGRSRSRPSAAIIAEARRLLAVGVRELTLVGINLRQYGQDLDPARGFWDLLLDIEQALAPDWKGKARLRISSLDPSELNGRGLEVLSRSSMICPHLHLSLQSGSLDILRRMNRGHYRPEEISRSLERLRTIWPLFALGADILTGFPGETEQDFVQTLEFCTSLPLSYVHVFPYSQRPGTPAARFPDQIRSGVRRERASRLREAVSSKRSAFLDRLTTERLVHLVMEDSRRGRCEYYVECRVQGPALPKRGQLISARPLGSDNEHLLVRPVHEGEVTP